MAEGAGDSGGVPGATDQEDRVVIIVREVGRLRYMPSDGRAETTIGAYDNNRPFC